MYTKTIDGVKYIIKPEEKMVIGISNYSFFNDCKKQDAYYYFATFGDKNMKNNVVCDIKAFARCNDKDEWDEEIGIKLVKARLDRQRHKKTAQNCKRLFNIMTEKISAFDKEAKYHHKKIQAIDSDINNYFLSGAVYERKN